MFLKKIAGGLVFYRAKQQLARSNLLGGARIKQLKSLYTQKNFGLSLRSIDETQNTHYWLRLNQVGFGVASGVVPFNEDGAAKKASGALIKNKNAKKFLNLGNRFYSRKEFKAAEKHFRNSLAIEEHAVTYFRLADTLRKQRKNEAAVEYYRKGWDIVPDIPEIKRRGLTALAFAYQNLEKFEEALRWFQVYRDLFPKDPKSWHWLGNMKAMLLRRCDAISDYQKSLELELSQNASPENPKVETFFREGLTLLNQGQLNKARGKFVAAAKAAKFTETKKILGKLTTILKEREGF